MPTKHPRATITFPPQLYDTIKRFAALQGVSFSSAVVGLLEAAHPPLMRSVALFEAAAEAPESVRDTLRSNLEEIEKQLTSSLSVTQSQMDWLTGLSSIPGTRTPGTERVSGRARGRGARGKTDPRACNTGVTISAHSKKSKKNNKLAKSKTHTKSRGKNG